MTSLIFSSAHIEIKLFTYLFKDLWHAQNKVFMKIVPFSCKYKNNSIKQKHIKVITVTDVLNLEE